MDINEKNVQTLIQSATDKIRGNIAYCVELYKSIKWKRVSIVIPLAPKPSQRPRLCGYRVYVPGASKNGTFFQNNVLPTLRGLFITTPCKVKLDIFVETPNSFTKTQKCLAEMKVLRPWASTGDVDNYEKALLDMIQPNEKRGHIGILMDDCLVIEMHSNKYYSIKPRYELTITFMDKIPEPLICTLRMKKCFNDETD